MATRFGASGPAKTQAVKIKWVVACLGAIILVLFTGLFFILQNSETSSAVAPTATPALAIQGSTVDVLYSATRIEEGAQLAPQMFTPVPIEAEKAPLGVVRSQDLNQVVGKFAKRLINSNMPLVMDDVTVERPVSALAIPPGYRAVTINVDPRKGVEGFARPNSRVDILWTYSQDGKKNVATIARFVKVLSVAGQTGQTEKAVIAAETTVTLLVTEKDAKKIELARNLGELTLALVGDQDTAGKGGDPESVSIEDLLGRPNGDGGQVAETPSDGVMYYTDPKTGKQVRYVLRNSRWSVDRAFGSE